MCDAVYVFRLAGHSDPVLAIEPHLKVRWAAPINVASHG